MVAIVVLLGLGLWALTDSNGGKLPTLEQIADALGGSQPAGGSTGGGGTLIPDAEPDPGGDGTDAGGDAPASGIATPTMPADAGTAVVRYVHDGDTLFLEDGRKVRLLGIDTPEIGDNLECFGNEAADALAAMLPAGTTVRTVADVRETDQYGRSLLFLYTADGRLVNLELVRDGFAEAVTYRPNALWKHEVETAEAEARAAGVGRWGACGF